MGTILQQGENDLGHFAHILLSVVEGKTRILHLNSQGAAIVHEIDSVGQAVATALNLPEMRAILQVADSFVQSQQ